MGSTIVRCSEPDHVVPIRLEPVRTVVIVVPTSYGSCDLYQRQTPLKRR
jgi:hypothetical protein